MKDSSKPGREKSYLLLAVRSTAQIVKNSLVFKQMLDFMKKEQSDRLPGLRYEIVIPCPVYKSETFDFFDALKNQGLVWCESSGKHITLPMPNMNTPEDNEVVSDAPLEQRYESEIMTQLRQPLEDDEIMINGVRIRIPQKVVPSIAKDALELALHAARKGTGEGTKAIGFMIVLTSKADFEDPNFGYIPDNGINKFKGNDAFVKDWKDKSRYLVSCFVQDAAMVIDGKSGRFLGEHFRFQLKTQDADQDGGIGYVTASAAGDYGCVAIKCSADHCLSDGVGRGYLKVFPGTKEATEVPIPKISHATS